MIESQQQRSMTFYAGFIKNFMNTIQNLRTKFNKRWWNENTSLRTCLEIRKQIEQAEILSSINSTKNYGKFKKLFA